MGRGQKDYRGESLLYGEPPRPLLGRGFGARLEAALSLGSLPATEENKRKVAAGQIGFDDLGPTQRSVFCWIERRTDRNDGVEPWTFEIAYWTRHGDDWLDPDGDPAMPEKEYIAKVARELEVLEALGLIVCAGDNGRSKQWATSELGRSML